MTEMAMITAHNEKRREIISFSTMLKTILIGLLFLSVGTILLNSEINALKPPKKFTAILGPDQQVIEDTNPFQWTQTDAHGTASFQANREMTEIHYKIYLDDIENVVGISIQKGNSGEIGSDDLVTIKETDVTNPEHYSTGGTIQGVITDDDVCPAHPLYDVDCTVFGLVYEFINHRAFLQIRTSDNTGMDNSGPGDLFIPGEIRGQIYPIPPSRIFESQINHEQQILDDVDDPTLWEHVVSHGTAQFIMNDDMTELTYTIELTNLENVIKIQILNDVVRQNTDFVLVEVQSYDPTEDFAPAGKITGIITNDDVCPSGHEDEAPILQCSVEGLVHEMINHRTYLQIKTDDGISPQNSGAGDLFTPGEIRGQIVPKAECINCIVNAENQILTIFKFETEDTPFLADTVTLLISPNPYAHNIGADFIEANSFGPTLTITDNDALDYDPTNGVIELVGVNPGVYSIMELKGPSGFLKTDTMYSSEEIFGEAYPHVQVTNLKIDFDDSTRPIAFDPPDIDEEILEKLEEFTATIGEIEITSNAQLPSSFVTLIENVFDEPSPQTVEFETTIDADWTIEETFENLGIPTYFSPSQTFESNQDIAFILPVFVAYNDEGQNIVMSPVIDEVTPSTDIVLRLDDIDVIETTGKSVNGVTLPLDIFAKDVGVSVEILEDIPSNIPEFTDTSIETSLFLDFDFVGSIDFSNENIFSESPTLDFSLPTDDTFSCPDGVQVFLLNEDTLQWEAITSGPLRNEALDEMISSIATCGYTQSLPHFSSYLVGTGYFDGTSGGLSNPGGGGGSSGRSGGFGHDHSSHDHGDGVGTGSSSGGDGTVTKYGTNQDGILDADKLENTTKVDFGFGGIVSDEFVFGTPAQFVAFTVIDPLSLDSELLSKEYDFGNAFEGTQMLIDVNEQKFPFKYDLDGEIKRVKIHEKEKYISFELENVIASEFTIRIPRSMLDANENNFQVLVTASPEKEVEYTIIESNENFVTLFVLLPNNAKDITIVGSNILEFDSDDKPAVQFEIEPSGYDVEFTVLDYLDTKYDFNEDFEGTSILVDVNDAMFPIQYYFDGEIYGITINEQSNSISFDLQNVVESDMTIRLLRNMLDADKNNFIALGTEDIPLTYDILDSASDSITLRLHLPENTQTLTLIGSKVVPEYGIFAVFILVIGISITLLISKKQTLAFNNL